MPRFFGHYQAKECYNAREISVYNMGVDLLNGGHGKFLRRKDPSSKSSHFLRKKITVAMTYSQTMPTPSVSQHDFLSLYGASYYVPYVMFEQLPVRPSDYVYIDESILKKAHEISVQFDIVDNWRMSSLQDRWLSYMDYNCGEVIPPLDSKLFSEGQFIQRIVFFLSLQTAILQLLANFFGRTPVTRTGPLCLLDPGGFERSGRAQSPAFVHSEHDDHWPTEFPAV